MTGTKSDSGFVVKTAVDGSYKVVVGGEVWLHSGATTVQARGRHHSTGDGTLRLTGKPMSSKGSDLLGSWSMLNYSYSVTENHVDMCVKTYSHLPVAIFSQVAPNKSLLCVAVNKKFNILSNQCSYLFVVFAGCFPANKEPFLNQLAHVILVHNWYRSTSTCFHVYSREYTCSACCHKF